MFHYRRILLVFLCSVVLFACGGGETTAPTPILAPTLQDSDNDGINDNVDNCANTPTGAEVDAQGCEIQTAPTDTDNDGIADDIDSCPNTPAGAEVDAQGCEIQTGDTVSIRLQAEDYTNYSDTTAGNTGGAYKTDDVDIELTTDTDGGFNVGFIDASEFLEYSLDLPAGIYAVSTRVASAVGGGIIR